jgi:hypothetical protein
MERRLTVPVFLGDLEPATGVESCTGPLTTNEESPSAALQ